MGMGNDTGGMDEAPVDAGGRGGGNGAVVVTGERGAGVGVGPARQSNPVGGVIVPVDPIFAMIERAARDSTVDIEKFERLMLMKERVEEQRAKRAFNAAVAAAKGRIGIISKNKTVDFTSQKGRTHYSHEDMSAVARAVDAVLPEFGLSYRFRSTQDGNRLRVTCILSHADGHSEENALETTEDHTGNKNAIQAIGSAATYLQRYTLKLSLGLASSTDDDGRTTAAAGPISDVQADHLRNAITESKADIDRFLKFYGIESLSDLPASKFDAAMKMIATRKAKVPA